MSSSGPLLVRWLGVAVATATVFWLGYGVGRVQSLVDIAQLSRDADTDRYTLSRGGLVVSFERLGGDGKPIVRSGDGNQLLDLSDWDRDSRIVVDGTLYELVRLYPQSSVDYQRYRLAETLHGDGWLLQREITLDASNEVQVEHSFVAQRPIRRVDLALAHVHEYFVDLQVKEDQVLLTVNRLTRDQIATGVQAPAAFRMSVSAAAGAPNVQFRSGQTTGVGARSFVADMSVDNPPRDTRVVLGYETIHVDSLPL
jgi:hypothetical protein